MATQIESKRIARLFFKDFCTYSTLHGVRYFVVRVRHWSERLWWLAAICLSLCLSFLMIHAFWLNWQQHPATLTTTNELNAVSKIPFPTVMICPQTKVVRSKFDLSSKFDSKNRLLPNVSESDKTRLMKLVHVCDYLRFKNQYAHEDIFDVIEGVAPTVEETTLSCSWKGAITKCSEYLQPVMTQQGVCFTFNGLNSRDIYTNEMAPGAMISKNNPNVSRWNMENGYEYGFRKTDYPIRGIDSDEITTLEINLVIDKRNDHYMCDFAYDEFTVYLMPSYETNSLIHIPFGIPPSQDIHIVISPKLITTSSGLRKFSPHRRQCFFQSERQLRFFKTYSQRNCQLECWANSTIKYCGCVDFSMPREKGTRICGATKINCFLEHSSKLRFAAGSECDCLPACTSMEFPTKIEQFPLNFLDDKHLNASQRQARLRISLQNSQVKIMERIETVTIADFLAMCGGVLGLFMGFSALSIVELIYYPFLRLFWMIQRLKEDDEKEKSNKSKNNANPGETSKDEQAPTKKRMSRLQSYLIEYCDNSNIHGLRYFSEKKLHSSERYYWAIGCIVSLSLCTWMTYNVWILWQTNPAVIKPAENIENAYTITPFPTVTICPEVKTTKQKFHLTHALNNLSNLSNAETQRLNALANVCPLLPHSVAFEDKFADESIYNTIQDIAPQFEDTLGACNWNNKVALSSCSEKMTPILTDEGLCFAFNALNSHEMYTNEMAPGMMMVTGNPNISHWSLDNSYDTPFSHKNEYPIRVTLSIGITHSLMFLSIDKRDFDNHCNHFDGGFKLVLTPPGEVIKMARNYFRIHFKKYNYIWIESKVTKTSEGLRSYTPDQRQCLFQSERRLRFFKMYTQSNCEEECLANFTSLECGCVHFSMPRDNKTKVCGGASVVCMKAAERKLQTDKIGLAFHSECHCLPACASIDYKALINRRNKDVNVDKNFETVVVTVKFKSIDVDERIERFTVVDFLAYCGGLLGVGMGISVLSIIEILFFGSLRLFWAVLDWKSNSVEPLNPKSIEEITIEDRDE